jgi:hypothetical protein
LLEAVFVWAVLAVRVLGLSAYGVGVVGGRGMTRDSIEGTGLERVESGGGLEYVSRNARVATVGGISGFFFFKMKGWVIVFRLPLVDNGALE